MERQESNTESRLSNCSHKVNQTISECSNEFEVSDTNKNKTKCFITIEPFIFFIFIAENITGIMMTNYVMAKTCENHFHFNQSVCKNINNANSSHVEALVQPYASAILTGMSSFSTFIPAIMSLFLGPWSDINGRKLLLIVPTLGFTLKNFLLVIFSIIPNLHPTVTLLTIIPVAITGGFVNLMAASFAYICDTSTEAQRSLRICIFEAAICLSSIAGILLSPVIVKTAKGNGYVIIFGLSAIINLITAVCGYFFIPETVKPNNNANEITNLFDVKLLKEIYSACFKKKQNFNRTIVFLVIASLSFTISVMEGESNVKYLFSRIKFNWTIVDYSEWVSASETLNIIGLLLGSLIFMKYLKLNDVFIAILAYATLALSDLFITFIPPNASNLLYYAGLIKIFSGLCGPAGRALISKYVPEKDIGKVFSLTTTSECVLPVAVAPLYTVLYNYTLLSFPSAFFFLSISIYVIIIIVYIIIYFTQITRVGPDFDSLINENNEE